MSCQQKRFQIQSNLFGSCFALFIAVGAPTMAHAQQQDDGTVTNQRADRDDNGEWGWLGLLGLAGSIGLKRRERHDDVRQGHAATR